MYGWNQRFQDRWTKVKNDPAQALHWKALPAEAKFQVTKDKTLFSLKALIGNWAGRQYPEFNIRNNNFIFPYTNRKSINDFVDKYFKIGVDVRASNDKGVYKITDIKKITITGIDEGWNKETILSSTKDFIALGVTTDWIVEVTSGRYIGSVLKVQEVLNSHEIRVGGYQTHSSAYKLVSPLYIILSETFSDADKVYLYPTNEMLYNPAGSIPDHNLHRELYPDLARKISMFSEVMTADDKAKAMSVLNMFTDLVLYDEGISMSDSDEIISVYVGAYAHALVDPARKDEILNHPLVKKWRERIDRMISLTSNDGDDFAIWIEGTYYNPNTIKSLLQNAMYIEWATGKDEFPELTKRLKQLAEGCKVELMPGFKTMMYWGDTQRYYETMAYRNMDKIATAMECLEIKTGEKDKELGDLREKIQSTAKPDQIDSPYLQRYTPFWNPYAEKVDDAYWLTKSGKIYHNSRLGFVFAFSGWNPEKDSVFFSSAWPGSGFDHNPNSDNIGLWRQGEWAIDWMRGYSSTDWETHYNCLAPCGEQVAFDKRGEVAFKSGKNWFIQKGTRSGDGVKEQSRTVFYYRTVGGVDISIVVDDLDIEALPTPERLLGYKHEEKAQMEASEFKHQINWYVPAPLFGKDSWMANASREAYVEGKQKVTLIPLMKPEDYTSIFYKNSDFAGKKIYPWVDLGSNKLEATRGYSLRVVPNKQIGKMRFVHLIYSGSDDITYKETTGGIAITQGKESFSFDYTNLTVIDGGSVFPPVDPAPVRILTIDVSKDVEKIILNIGR